MSILSNWFKTIIYRTSPAYLMRVLKGEIYNVYYRQGIFERKAILEPIRNSNGTKLLHLLKSKQKTQFPYSLGATQVGGFTAQECSIQEQNPNRYFLNYNDGKIELDEQKKGMILATINKHLVKGHVVGVQSVRLGLITLVCKILLLVNVLTIYMSYASNQVRSSGIPTTKEEFLKEKNQYAKNESN